MGSQKQQKITEILKKGGFPSELLTDIVLEILKPTQGTIDDEDCQVTCEDHILLLGVIICSARYPKELGNIQEVLEKLVERSDQLTLYDQGRLWHVCAYYRWRIDDDFYLSLASINRSVSFLKKENSKLGKAYLSRVHDTIGQVLTLQGRLREARCEFEIALKYRDYEPNDVGRALTLGNLGRLCLEIGDISSALDYLHSDLEIVDRFLPERTQLLSQLYSHLATCHMELGDLSQSQKYLDKSLKIATENNDVVNCVFGLLGLVRLALKKDEVESARKMCSGIRSEIENEVLSEAYRSEMLWMINEVEGEIHSSLNHWERANRFYVEARKWMTESIRSSPLEEARLLGKHAFALELSGNVSEAARAMRLALRLLDATEAHELRTQFENKLQDLAKDSWTLHTVGRFLGQGQISKLLAQTGKSEFRGQRAEVVVLFSDLRNFTKISEHMEPETIVGFLNRYLGSMVRCIESFGGFVDKFVGDAILAIFSLPEPQPDDADRAVQAALLMGEELEYFNRSLDSSAPQLKHGIGIHYGPLVSGLMGTPQKRSFTVIGDTVNTASRLEGMTKTVDAQILISQNVVSKLEKPEEYLLCPLGSFPVRGRTEPLGVSALEGLRKATPGFQKIHVQIEKFQKAMKLLENGNFLGAKREFSSLQEVTAGTPFSKRCQILAKKAEEYLEQPAD